MKYKELDIPDDIYEAAVLFANTDTKQGTIDGGKLRTITGFVVGAMWARGLLKE